MDPAALSAKYAKALQTIQSKNDELEGVFQEAKSLEKENQQIKVELQDARKSAAEWQTKYEALSKNEAKLQEHLKMQQQMLQQYIEVASESAQTKHQMLLNPPLEPAKPQLVEMATSVMLPTPQNPTPPPPQMQSQQNNTAVEQQLTQLTETRLNEFSAQQTTEIRSLKDEIGNLQSVTKASMERQAAEYQESLKRHQETIEKLQKDLEGLTEENGQLKSMKESLENAQRAYKSDFTSSFNTIKGLEAEIEKQKGQVAKLEQEKKAHADVVKQRDAKAGKLEEMMTAMQQKQQAAAQETIEIEAVEQKTRERLQAEWQSMARENQRLSMQSEHAAKAADVAKEECKHLQRQVHAVRISLNEARELSLKEVAALTTENENMLVDLQAVAAEREILRRQLMEVDPRLRGAGAGGVPGSTAQLLLEQNKGGVQEPPDYNDRSTSGSGGGAQQTTHHHHPGQASSGAGGHSTALRGVTSSATSSNSSSHHKHHSPPVDIDEPYPIVASTAPRSSAGGGAFESGVDHMGSGPSANDLNETPINTPRKGVSFASDMSSRIHSSEDVSAVTVNTTALPATTAKQQQQQHNNNAGLDDVSVDDLNTHTATSKELAEALSALTTQRRLVRELLEARSEDAEQIKALEQQVQKAQSVADNNHNVDGEAAAATQLDDLTREKTQHDAALACLIEELRLLMGEAVAASTHALQLLTAVSVMQQRNTNTSQENNNNNAHVAAQLKAALEAAMQTVSFSPENPGSEIGALLQHLLPTQIPLTPCSRYPEAPWNELQQSSSSTKHVAKTVKAECLRLLNDVVARFDGEQQRRGAVLTAGGHAVDLRVQERPITSADQHLAAFYSAGNNKQQPHTQQQQQQQQHPSVPAQQALQQVVPPENNSHQRAPQHYEQIDINDLIYNNTNTNTNNNNNNNVVIAATNTNINYNQAHQQHGGIHSFAVQPISVIHEDQQKQLQQLQQQHQQIVSPTNNTNNNTAPSGPTSRFYTTTNTAAATNSSGSSTTATSNNPPDLNDSRPDATLTTLIEETTTPIQPTRQQAPPAATTTTTTAAASTAGSGVPVSVSRDPLKAFLAKNKTLIESIGMRSTQSAN